MRNLWRRLLVKLGIRRKGRILHGATAEVSIIGADGKRVVLGVYKNVYFSSTRDATPSYVLGAEKKTYIAGKQKWCSPLNPCSPEKCIANGVLDCGCSCHNPSEPKRLLTGKTGVKHFTTGKLWTEAELFRERHCAECLVDPKPCCGAARNTGHAEGCTHVCTHSYQRFAP